MPSLLEEIEAAYKARVIPTTFKELRKIFVTDLIEAQPELTPEQTRSIKEYFDEHGTLVGLASNHRSE